MCKSSVLSDNKITKTVVNRDSAVLRLSAHKLSKQSVATAYFIHAFVIQEHALLFASSFLSHKDQRTVTASDGPHGNNSRLHIYRVLVS